MYFVGMFKNWFYKNNHSTVMHIIHIEMAFQKEWREQKCGELNVIGTESTTVISII